MSPFPSTHRLSSYLSGSFTFLPLLYHLFHLHLHPPLYPPLCSSSSLFFPLSSLSSFPFPFLLLLLHFSSLFLFFLNYPPPSSSSSIILHLRLHPYLLPSSSPIFFSHLSLPASPLQLLFFPFPFHPPPSSIAVMQPRRMTDHRQHGVSSLISGPSESAPTLQPAEREAVELHGELRCHSH